jgi:hypothetical protein
MMGVQLTELVWVEILDAVSGRNQHPGLRLHQKRVPILTPAKTSLTMAVIPLDEEA